MTRAAAADARGTTTSSCLIATTPAAGGARLAAALRAAGLVGSPADYFSPGLASHLSRKWGLLDPPAALPARYLEAVLRAATGDNGFCSAVVPWVHHRWLVRMARLASSGSDGIHRSDADTVAAVLPGVRYVFVRQVDVTRQALRWWTLHREAVGLPSVPRAADRQEIRWVEAAIERQESAWRAYFAVHGLDFYEIELESLVERPLAVVTDALRWLDPGLVDTPEATTRVADVLASAPVSRQLAAPVGEPSRPGWIAYREARAGLSPVLGGRRGVARRRHSARYPGRISSEAEGRLRILFSVRPFRGHLHPVIPLIRACRRLGHLVAVATAEDVATVITDCGLPWLPAGLNPREASLIFPGEDSDYGYSTVKAKVEDLLELAMTQFRPDVIVREPTDLAGAVAAETLRALSVTYGLGHFIPASSWHVLGAAETIGRLRRDYGLARDDELSSLYSGLYLEVLPASFELIHPLPVERVQRLRYTPWDGDALEAQPSAGGLEVAGAAGSRPAVLVTLGTVYNSESGLFQRFFEALEGEEVDVICTVGEDADPALLERAPANVRCERYVSHSRILPRCQAMLCHGGLNTVLGALSCGVPVVCVPLGSDHAYNAAQCEANGVGVCLPEAQASPERIREAVRRMLHEPAFRERAGDLERRLAERPGPPATVRRIEALIRAAAVGAGGSG